MTPLLRGILIVAGVLLILWLLGFGVHIGARP